MFVSDGSSDKTATILSTWCAHRPRARFICADTSIGKAASLNLALTGAADEELFVVYDADVVANRSSVARLAEAFGDPAVAAVSGCTLPSGKPSVPSACYAALEAWMHQFVNQSAIDRLDLSPQINGSHCAFRLEALRQAGGFPQALSEDVTLRQKIVVSLEREPRQLENGIEVLPVETFLRRLWDGAIVA